MESKWSSSLEIPQVLIVEEDLVTALNFKFQLQRMGLIVADLLRSGEQALEVAHWMPVDLVLIDLHLHGRLDGHATANQLRGFLPVPVIFVGDKPDQAEPTPADPALANSCLVSRKVSEEDLARSIHTLMDV